MQRAEGWGPATLASTVGTTGPGSWVKPPAQVFPNWSYTVVTANSTSTVTITYALQGTLDNSTAPAAGYIYSLSTGSGAGTTHATNKLARQVRIRIDSISSTSSTAPTATVVAAGSL